MTRLKQAHHIFIANTQMPRLCDFWHKWKYDKERSEKLETYCEMCFRCRSTRLYWSGDAHRYTFDILD
jgi:hypothetical protein